eukprot:gnl/TRDRNA2_/TRDRNA2_177123_c0_seq1.p1 gnl/TRDRNA2_/TRDRNA2_177123_c0~~gnl/TRDRNA2_/TRDRNA2_177123_c0_seq1.p1  ORF type:complete len:216 (-),score=30.05 gnl/TRDRNA2_/TRDRNA2_177123_c0_seq1:5-652(-)
MSWKQVEGSDHKKGTGRPPPGGRGAQEPVVYCLGCGQWVYRWRLAEDCECGQAFPAAEVAKNRELAEQREQHQYTESFGDYGDLSEWQEDTTKRGGTEGLAKARVPWTALKDQSAKRRKRSRGQWSVPEHQEVKEEGMDVPEVKMRLVPSAMPPEVGGDDDQVGPEGSVAEEPPTGQAGREDPGDDNSDGKGSCQDNGQVGHIPGDTDEDNEQYR